MRSCPICDSRYKEFMWSSGYIVPDGWTRPNRIDWNRCECGMVYGDNPTATQSDYDTYYKERYGYGVTDEACLNRLSKRAQYIMDRTGKRARIVDFGGGEGYLSLKLEENGYKDVWNYNVGNQMPVNCDVIIAEHVLEHVYDMNTAMLLISLAIKNNGMLIVDVPDAGRIAMERNPKTPILDFSQVHINHFRQIDMLNLMHKWGFELVESQGYHERGSGCRMYVFVANRNIVGNESEKFVRKNIQDKINKLIALGKEPVCVWGFGDIASECLANHFPNVKYFISEDPAFWDQTIKGLPVYKKPIDNLPIVVIAQSQRDIILARIKETCSNRAIII